MGVLQREHWTVFLNSRSFALSSETGWATRWSTPSSVTDALEDIGEGGLEAGGGEQSLGLSEGGPEGVR